MKVEGLLLFILSCHRINAASQPKSSLELNVEFADAIKMLTDGQTRAQGIKNLVNLLYDDDPMTMELAKNTWMEQIFDSFVKNEMKIDEKKFYLFIINKFLEDAKELSIPLMFKMRMEAHIISFLDDFDASKIALVSLIKIASFSEGKYLRELLKLGLVDKLAKLLKNIAKLFMETGPDTDDMNAHINLIKLALMVFQVSLDQVQVVFPLIPPLLKSIVDIDEDSFIYYSVSSILLLLENCPEISEDPEDDNNRLVELLLDGNVIGTLIDLPILDRLGYTQPCTSFDEVAKASQQTTERTIAWAAEIIDNLSSRKQAESLKLNRVFDAATRFFNPNRPLAIRKFATKLLTSLTAADRVFVRKFLENKEYIDILNQILEKVDGDEDLQTFLAVLIANLFVDLEGSYEKLCLIKFIPFINKYFKDGTDVNSLSYFMELLGYLNADVKYEELTKEADEKIDENNILRALKLIQTNDIETEAEKSSD